MKMKRIMAAVVAAAMTLAFAGCSSTNTDTNADTSAADANAETSAAADAADTTAEKDSYTIGVIQFGSHPSLDNCYQGIENGLMSSSIADKITIDRQDGNFDSATCDSIAKNMASKNYDLIFAIATPAAVSAYSATQNSQTPVIFTAVSDPVAAGLVESLDAGSKNCIGTSDVLDLEAQVALIQALQPDVKTIGILYTTSEANSVSNLARLEEITGTMDITVEAQGVQSAADIPQAAATLASKVDCINNFTDNNVVSNLSVLLEKANAANIPVYGSEIEQVYNGCIASISIDYVALGEKTAEMGLEVLNGADPQTMAVGTITEGTPVVNTDVLAQFGIELPESYANAEKVVTGGNSEE